MDETDVHEAMVDILGFEVPETVTKILFVAIVALVALVASRLLGRTLRRLLDRSNVPSASIFINVVKGLVWAFALLMVLRPVFGIEPTGFVAALGVTSVAISLGLQDTISNLFGGLSLMVSKVIAPGDVVTVSGVTGEVTDISWRATTLRQFNGDVQVIPNSVLSNTALTKLAPFQAGEYQLPVVLAKDADYDAVCHEVDELARKALGVYFDEEFGIPVFIREYNSFGILATISIHAKPGISPGKARTAVGQAIAGRSWLA